MGKHLLLLATTMLAAAQVHADIEPKSKTVIGPSNIYLYDGATALQAGDAVKGVPLTLKGLEMAQGRREEKIGHANLCAGFLLLGQPKTALVHCDWVLERDPYHWRTYNNRAIAYLRLERFEESEADIKKGQELNPRSEKLKQVKGMYLDEVRPVDEKITIDDRRNEPQSPVREHE
jgi:tetratricopeptide (TPR) repeat protein